MSASPGVLGQMVPTLAALALPLAELALRATLLLALGFLAERVLRRAPAAARHAVWVATFAGLALLPLLAPVLPRVALPVLPGSFATSGMNESPRGGDGASEVGGSVPVKAAARPAPGGGAPRDATAAEGAAIGTGRASIDGAPLAAPAGDATPAVPRSPGAVATWLAALAVPTAVGASDGPTPLLAAAAALVVLALTGTTLVACYLLLGMVAAWLLVRRARPLGEHPRWRALLDRAVAEQRPGRRPALAVSGSVSVPLLCGLLRPTILLPAAADGWSEDERRRVLAHEVAHAARRDGLLQVAARAVAALYWWHPAAGRALSRLVLTAELACDDRVLAAGAGGADYARQLLDLARRAAPAGRAAPALHPVAVAMARRPHLTVRIRALLDEARPRGPLPRTATAVGVAAVLAAAVLVAPVRLTAADEGFATVRPAMALSWANGPVPGGAGFGGGSAAGGSAAGDGAAAAGAAAAGGGESRGGGAAGKPAAAGPGSGSAVAALDSADGRAERPRTDRSRGGRRSGTSRGASGSHFDRAWASDRIAAQRHRMTPLMQAVLAGDDAAVRRLLDSGADPDRGVRSLGTPLILAADAGDARLVELLLARGADPDRAETGGERPGDLQRTPLGSAARAGDPATVELLLAAGAAVDAAPRGDATPLMTAARHGHEPLVRRFLAAGADVDARVPGDGTPLIEAARGGHLDIVDLLLAAGAPPDTAVVGDGNPLVMAAAGGHREVLDRLLEAGADPDVWVPGDESALYHAIDRGDAWMVERLIAAGADVTGRWPEEEGPLALAAQADDRRVVELLWQAGARR